MRVMSQEMSSSEWDGMLSTEFPLRVTFTIQICQWVDNTQTTKEAWQKEA